MSEARPDTPAVLDRATLQAGLRLDDYACTATPQRQRAYHAAAGVDTAAFADMADPSVLANDCIHATRALKGRDDVNLHLWQRVVQQAPVRLGEPLRLAGRLAAVEPARRGLRSIFAADFVRPDGSRPLACEMGTLHVDPAAAQAAPPGGTPAEPADLAGWKELSTVALTADRVRAYSFEFPDYAFHFEPAVAARAGLPAPVAQGLMSLTLMTGAIWAEGAPARLDLEVRFLRPAFWGDRVTLWRRGAEYLCVKPGGEAVSRGVVHALER